ncbi:ABC transporter ATP-binding protein [Cryobacterium lactosi]|uniref:ABC transporter ATP-binding protein n=1 Tax=Cryobacterium lactosi TaxID=1259202 RepID=A0A4R9BX36_9MICO|nr:ABC transporter ATP-binding protein [Cryobacterium lactosi]TFD92065.1 ABC transporter ATP-binding protein [Cryobacterium lactosi]
MTNPAVFAQPASAGGAAPIIQARGLVKTFGQTQALRGIDLDIDRGEVVAIMGPSGSGKSTLLHALAGVIVPDAGTVTVDSRVISVLREPERAALRLRKFGFVFQFGQLLPDLTALDNVTIPLLLAGRKRADAIRQSSAWLDRLGLAGEARQLPGELSGGQAQRVAIARALVMKPMVLFADEPTGSLDSLAAENVLTAMLDLVREEGTTVVMITHDPRTAAYADREVIVRDGQLSAAHAPQTLTSATP